MSDDAQVLVPDRTIQLGGEEVEVRRFRFRESLRAVRIAQPIIEALSELPTTATIDDILQVMAEHEEAWFQLMAMSTGRDISWLQDLTEEDGHTLAMTFWSVHQDFFFRRLLMKGLNRDLESVVASTSYASSSSPDTAPSTTSPTTTPGPSSSASGTPATESDGNDAPK